VRAGGNVVDLRRLDVHAADHDDVGPLEFGRRRAADVLVDETDRPAFGHIGRDEEEALRRHEGAHALHQAVGVVERAKSGGVMREDAQHPALVPDRDRAAHTTSVCWRRHGRLPRAGTQEILAEILRLQPKGFRLLVKLL